MRKPALLAAAIALVVAGALLLLLLHPPRGREIVIVYGAHLDGALYPGRLVQRREAPRHASLQEIARWLVAVKRKVPARGRGLVVVFGGNTLLGGDDVSNYFRGEPAAKILKNLDIDALVPLEKELSLGAGLSRAASGLPLLLSNGRSGEVRRSVVKDVMGLRVALYGFTEPPSSAALGEADLPAGAGLTGDAAALRGAMARDGADLRVLAAACADYRWIPEKLPAVDIVIPLRFSRTLPPGEPGRLGRVCVLPWADARSFMGECRIEMPRGGGAPRIEARLHGAGGWEQSPVAPFDAVYGAYFDRFNALFGGAYPRVADLFYGVGAQGLTHDAAYFRASPLGELVTTRMAQATGADVALLNHLALRAPLEGPVGFDQLMRALPFSNKLVLMELTGGMLTSLMGRNALESRRFLQQSGLQVRYRKDEPRSVEVFFAGAPLRGGGSSLTAVNDYVAGGARGQEPEFVKVPGRVQTQVRTGDLVYDTLRTACYVLPPFPETLRREGGSEEEVRALVRMGSELAASRKDEALVLWAQALAAGGPGALAAVRAAVPPERWLVVEGGALECGGRLRLAAAKYREAIVRFPRSAGPRLALGRLYFREGLSRRALVEFRGAGASEPSCAEARMLEGAALLSLFRYDEALDALGAACALDGKSRDAALLLALAHFKRGEPRAAAAALSSIDTTGPSCDTIIGLRESLESE